LAIIAYQFSFLAARKASNRKKSVQNKLFDILIKGFDEGLVHIDIVSKIWSGYEKSPIRAEKRQAARKLTHCLLQSVSADHVE
jgi:hypothetical protein